MASRVQSNGLTTAEVNERVKQYGLNQLPSAKPKNLFHIAKDVMSEPMFMLLVACGAVYIVIGDYQEGMILLLAIFVIIGITFYQYQKTERALDALKRLSSPRALVIRNGKKVRISGSDVVPGDILLLNAGDRIAADALLLDTNHLEVDESILTGESIPVQKIPGDRQQTVEKRQDSLFSGSLVVRGQALARVIKTGVHTELGKIGKVLQQIDSSKTRLQSETKILIRNLAIGAGFISVMVILVFYWTRGDFVQALLNGLASAMAILPEEFPVVMTIFIALGAWRLSKKKVLTRKPATIETLGSATVLCTDKTGTLTQNAMEVTAVSVNGSMIEKSNFLKNQSSTLPILKAANHASSKGSFDPMEMAIREISDSIGTLPTYEVVHEYALSEKLMAMTIVSSLNDEETLYASCKGAPESVFKICGLSDAEIVKELQKVKKLAGRGLRVIGVAESESLPTELPDCQSDLDLSYLGLIGLEDPIRKEVPGAIKQCKEAGIRVIMITGDYPVTAQNIASQIGLPKHGTVLTGADLDELNDDALKKKIVNTTVIARAIPEQKLRIIRALEANGEVVAMTGDGVNDAPALKAADIGVAMGSKGTDVAREASSLVLLDDNFASIVTGVRLGRRIFDNLRKAMSYILAIHVPIIGLALLPAFFKDIPILMFPVHIVFMELIIDPVCSVAFEAEGEEKGIMNRPPRKKDDVFFSTARILFSLLQGLLVLMVVLVIYFLSLRHGYSDGQVRAISFTSLIIGNIFLIITNLSETRSFVNIIFSKNLAVKLILGGAIIVLILINILSPLQEIFSFDNFSYRDSFPMFIGGFCILLVLEIVKLLRRRFQ